MPAGKSRLALLMRNRKRKGMKAYRIKMKQQHEAAAKIQSVMRAKMSKRNYLKTLSKIVRAQAMLRGRIVKLRLRRKRCCAQRIQSRVRGIAVRKDMRKMKDAATDVQRRARGVITRTLLRRKKKYDASVVQTPDAVKELASRSQQKNVVGNWKQMLDPETLQYWYLFDKEGVPLRACWLAPKEFGSTFHCRFDPCIDMNDCFKGVCPKVFATQRELDAHRDQGHRWTCFMYVVVYLSLSHTNLLYTHTHTHTYIQVSDRIKL